MTKREKSEQDSMKIIVYAFVCGFIAVILSLIF